MIPAFLMFLLLAGCVSGAGADGGAPPSPAASPATEPGPGQQPVAASFAPEHAASDGPLPAAGRVDAAGEAAPDSQTRGPRDGRRTPPGAGAVLATLHIESLARGGTTPTGLPVTFGQVFAAGDVPAGHTVFATLAGAPVPLQVDVKSRYADGSLKHAVLSGIVPRGGRIGLGLASREEDAPPEPLGLDALTADSDTAITLTIGETGYSASLRRAMLAGSPDIWLRGPVVTEAHYRAPFLDAELQAHPLLTARFHVRAYATGDVRVDAIVENTAALAPGARNIAYTAQIASGDDVVMAAEEIVHHHHSRWRRTHWLGTDPALHLEHDLEYLMHTGAIPQFDTRIAVNPKALAGLRSAWNADRGARSGIPVKAIMGAGLALEYMPNTGGRPDLGLLPGWVSLYLLTMDQGAALTTYGTADAAAHWPVHYRDSATGLPLSLEDYPGATVHPNVAALPGNPLPECSDCDTGMVPDTAHQPGMVFVPYLLTGDYYYLEELHFWTNWNSFRTSPRNRDYGKARYRWQQVRGQAWSMRTLLQTVFVTPDDHPMKRYFRTQLDNNFKYYRARYVDNPRANRLGWIRPGWTNPKRDTHIVSPWQDDFFTTIMNYARHLGFEQAEPILDWKIRFAMKRMTDPVYCWQFATVYHMVVSEPGPGARFETLAEAWLPTLRDQFPQRWERISAARCGTAAMSAAAGLGKAGDFAGYPNSPVGYPAALRPVIAAAVELGLEGSQTAWDRLLNAPRQPRFGENPAFAIDPRPVSR